MAEPYRDDFDVHKEVEDLRRERQLLKEENLALEMKNDVLRQIVDALREQLKVFNRERNVLIFVAFACLGLMLLSGMHDSIWRNVIE